MDKTLKKKLIIVSVIGIILMLITGVVQILLDIPRVQAREVTACLCPWDSPASILEWVAISSSRGSSQSRE